MTGIETERIIAGRYLLTRYVREGAGAAIWEAEDRWSPASSVDVALLAPPPWGNGEGKARARRSIERLVFPWFSEPAAVRLLGYGQDEATRFVVMEHVAGPSLQDRLATDGPLPPRSAAWIAGTVARVVQRMHSVGIAHGDLRPETIVLTSEGGVKVLDLGLTPAAWGRPDEAEVNTGNGNDADRGREQESARAADVRAIGSLLFEMLTGTLPPGGEPVDRASVADALAGVSPPVPDRMSRICTQALSADAASASPTAGMLGSALIGMAAEDSAGEGTLLILPEDTAAVGGHGPEPLVAVEGDEAPVASPAAHEAETSPQPDPSARRGLRALMVATIVLLVGGGVGVAVTRSIGGGNGAGAPAATRGPSAGPTASAPPSTPSTTPPAATPTPGTSGAAAAPVVPTVAGLTVAQARDALEAAGFVVVGAVPVEGTPGQVIRTVPAAGTSASPGAEVVLFVGVEPDRLPSSQPTGSG